MLSVRPMQVGDLPATFRVRLSTVENSVTMEELERVYGITPASVAEGMAADIKGWLCEENGNVLGFSMGERSTAEVLVVAVLPAHEGRGIGRSVLARVQGWLFSEGNEEIWLRANPDPKVRATGFYRKLGWRPSGAFEGEEQILTLRR